MDISAAASARIAKEEASAAAKDSRKAANSKATVKQIEAIKKELNKKPPPNAAKKKQLETKLAELEASL